MIRLPKYLLIGCLLLGAESLVSQETVPFPKKLDVTGFRQVLAVVDDIYISGQPEEQSFQKLKSEGVTTVINLRTEQEMSNRNSVPFEEREVVENLGMKYVHIPLGGTDAPYTNDAVKAFASALASADGKVLLHCTVAWRASHMWAAYLIQYKGFPPAKAIEHAKAINFGDVPLEGLLGKKMIIDFE